MNLNLTELTKEFPWLKGVIKDAMLYVDNETTENDMNNFIIANTPEIEIPVYADDDYEGKEAYQAGKNLYPEPYVNGANDDLKKGWHAKEREANNQMV